MTKHKKTTRTLAETIRRNLDKKICPQISLDLDDHLYKFLALKQKVPKELWSYIWLDLKDNDSGTA